ncbi:MAG: hypothetical protein IPM38_11300 [Ignavibacteria bacterium]|nr:hypothetical protein [Ignavibacteria bacterium]
MRINLRNKVSTVVGLSERSEHDQQQIISPLLVLVSGASVTNNKRKRDFGSSMVVGDQKVCGDRTEIKVYKVQTFWNTNNGIKNVTFSAVVGLSERSERDQQQTET